MNIIILNYSKRGNWDNSHIFVANRASLRNEQMHFYLYLR